MGELRRVGDDIDLAAGDGGGEQRIARSHGEILAVS
jgi:hypothetical protein